MISKKFTAFAAALALSASGPAIAQANTPAALPQAETVSADSAMFGGEDGFGWVMGGLVVAAVAVVLVLIYTGDDDEDDGGVDTPVSP